MATKVILPKGECQICGRAISMRDGYIVTHGYTVPGASLGDFHNRTSDCFGSGKLSYAESCVAVSQYKEMVKKSWANVEKQFRDHEKNPPAEITRLEQVRGDAWAPKKRVTYTRPDGFDPQRLNPRIANYDGAYAERRADLRNTLQACAAVVTRLEKRIADWKPA